MRVLPAVYFPPVRGVRLTISSRFGAVRESGRRGVCGGGHCGVDVRGPAGTSVLAMSDGVLTWHTDSKSGESFALLKVADDWQWRYFHVDPVARAGVVRAGAEIAVISRGGPSGPHLHLGLYDGRASVQALTDRAGYVDPYPALLTII